MRHTSEQMQIAVEEWQTSGLSKKAFCRERSITYQTFHYWCKRLINASAPGFTEIRVRASERTGCEIVFPSGARVILEGAPSASWLREVVG